MLTTRPFYETISRLRSEETIVLYSNLSAITTEDEAEVTDFLESEWSNECLDYPYVAPEFDASAAVWAARIVYTAAQLLLYRDSSEEALPALLPVYLTAPTAGNILSADLCLRMLPPLLVQMAAVDPDDTVIPLLEAHLHQWHYSGIGYKASEEGFDFSAIRQSDCAMQLYADRIIARKDKARAALPEIAPLINAAMGDLSAHYWK